MEQYSSFFLLLSGPPWCEYATICSSFCEWAFVFIPLPTLGLLIRLMCKFSCKSIFVDMCICPTNGLLDPQAAADSCPGEMVPGHPHHYLRQCHCWGSPTLSSTTVLHFSPSEGCGFSFYFPEIEHPFHTLVSHLDITLCEVLFRYFAHLHVFGWFFFILLVYGNYLHILSRTVPYWIYVLQVYFLSLWFAFLLFEWSSNEQSFLILLKFILSVFSIIAVLFCVLFKKSVSQRLDGVLPCFLPAALLFYLSL